MSHWYDNTGTLHAYVENKSKPGTFRPADLRDAKKNLWKPSVTTVLQKINKPMVNDYRVRVAVDIALNEMTFIPGLRIPEETVKQISERSMERALEAAEYGTILHALISDILHDRLSTIQHTELQEEIAYEAVKWIHDNGFEVEYSELTVVSKDAAGTIDLVGRHYGEACIVDWKSQDAESPDKFNWYEDWPIQMAGYEDILQQFMPGLHYGEERRHISVAISRLKPGVIAAKDWSFDKRMNNQRAMRAWRSIFEYWKAVSGMDIEETEEPQGSFL